MLPFQLPGFVAFGVQFDGLFQIFEGALLISFQVLGTAPFGVCFGEIGFQVDRFVEESNSFIQTFLRDQELADEQCRLVIERIQLQHILVIGCSSVNIAHRFMDTAAQQVGCFFFRSQRDGFFHIGKRFGCLLHRQQYPGTHQIGIREIFFQGDRFRQVGNSP